MLIARPAVTGAYEAPAELGIWLSGLQSFLAHGQRQFSGVSAKTPRTDFKKEIELVHAGLRRCALLNARILTSAGGAANPAHSVIGRVTVADLLELSEMLSELILINEALANSTLIGTGQWCSWSDMLDRRLDEIAAVGQLIDHSEMLGRRFLPGPLAELGNDSSSLTAETAELILILPRFGMVLKWLSIVGKMLEADEPLKPALLIFSRVNELISDLTRYINNRLDKLPEQETELFATLDAASYTASIELKKVYSQELAGISELRPTPSIFARMETAHSLLNDGFQQILAGITRALHPETEIVELFPEFKTKLDQSIELRAELRSAAQAIQAAEKTPEARQIEKMQKVLRHFMNGSMRYLFYKDTETVERFIEEILVTSQSKDLVPILHRFGAYLETLFGQVSLRSVLVDHPFEKN